MKALEKVLEENQINIKKYGVKRRFHNFNDWYNFTLDYVIKTKY